MSRRVSCLVTAALFTGSCATTSSLSSSGYRGPPSAELEWERASAESVGLDARALGQLIELIRQTPPRDFRALVVAKDGKLVVDEYFNSFWRTNVHDIRSAGKSVTSMLAGVAEDRGLLKRSDSVVGFFADQAPAGDSKHGAMRVEHLLTMSSGLASDDYDAESPGTEGRMIRTDDFVRFVLGLPMAFEPGEKYAYSSAVAFLLGAVVENASGQRLEDFARQHLFGPLGIHELYWQASPQGRTTGMGNLYMRASDFAKLGQVMLDEGRWKDRSVLSPEWIRASIRSAHDIDSVDPFASGYGFMWYLARMSVGDRKLEVFFASGNGGNKLFVVPEVELVVVTFSSAYGQGRGHQRSHNIFAKVLEALAE